MARVLDLGCGEGKSPIRANLSANDAIIGVDIDPERILVAKEQYPDRSFHCARGESLPFADASFDRVVSAVALPYMDIPKALKEVRRVLVPGGTVFFSVHALRFTLQELRRSVPRPVPTLFRIFVILNGIWFHVNGTVLKVAGRTESFQTQRGLKLVLARSGFVEVQFSRPDGRLIVEAKRSEAA